MVKNQKFEMFQRVLHKKTGGVYIILGVPKELRIEKNNEAAYAYRDDLDTDEPIWIRSQCEMEDGRFEAIT